MPDHPSTPTLVVRPTQAAQSTIDEQGRQIAVTLKSLRPRLSHWLRISASPYEVSMGLFVDQKRPVSLRQFDQIPMRPGDHVRQIKLMTHYLAGQAVAFVGDSDCASLLLCLLNKSHRQRPRRMLLLDFDERLLDAARLAAKQFGFDHILETRLYNAFDPLPPYLVGQFDWFYTNPPYGSHNQGASARLFITRGCELTRPNGMGCIILPHDGERGWTRDAMYMTQRFLSEHGWVISNKLSELHRYRLDDDRELTSSLMLVEHITDPTVQVMPYAGRRVAFDEIPLFYGRNVSQPYPRYIRSDSAQDFDWA